MIAHKNLAVRDENNTNPQFEERKAMEDNIRATTQHDNILRKLLDGTEEIPKGIDYS